MAAKIHTVKCWPNYFDAIESGEKNFDVRRNDRSYQRGDLIVFEKYDPESNLFFTNDKGIRVKAARKIKYVLSDFKGIEPGYAVLGLGYTQKAL